MQKLLSQLLRLVVAAFKAETRNWVGVIDLTTILGCLIILAANLPGGASLVRLLLQYFEIPFEPLPNWFLAIFMFLIFGFAIYSLKQVADQIRLSLISHPRTRGRGVRRRQ